MITFCRHCEELSTMEMEVIKGEVLLLKAPKEGSEADDYVEVMCVLSDISFGYIVPRLNRLNKFN